MNKKAADTLDMHAGHIFRPLATSSFFSSSSFTSSSCILPLLPPLYPPSIVSLRYVYSAEKKRMPVRAAGCPYSADESSAKQTTPDRIPPYPAVTPDETSNESP
jgi:hypothetical protein